MIETLSATARGQYARLDRYYPEWKFADECGVSLNALEQLQTFGVAESRLFNVSMPLRPERLMLQWRSVRQGESNK